jgi:hypothetical protein
MEVSAESMAAGAPHTGNSREDRNVSSADGVTDLVRNYRAAVEATPVSMVPISLKAG